MVQPLSVSTGENSKILYFNKDKKNIPLIQNFLKDLGIKRDYRKYFLKSLSRRTDSYEEASTKKGDVIVSAFIGKEKLILKIYFANDNDFDKIGKLIIKYFS